MRIKVEIEEVELANERGGLVNGVRATCLECGHETESYGVGEGSRARCLVLLREECPLSQNNFYVEG